MKILQLNTVYKVSSPGRIVYELNEIIEKNGYIGNVGYGRGDWNGKNLFKIGNKSDFYLHALGTRLFDKHGLKSKRATKDFVNFIDNLDIDIFHLHNIHGYYINYPILFNYLMEKDRPVIWTFHDCWPFTGHCAYYDFVGCKKWQKFCFNCPQKRRYPESILFDNSENNFLLKKKYFTELKDLTIVTPSVWLAKEVKKSFFSDNDVSIIYNGIDLDLFKVKKSFFRDKRELRDKFIILGVANIWNKRKGFEFFLELSKIIKKDEIIVLFGLNKKQLKKLPNNIIGIEKTYNLELLVDVYNSSDVFINPTLEDNFPSTNIESLACGTPVVTFKSGGSPESVNEETGIVVERGNIKELYNAIKIVKRNGKGYYIKSCRNRAVKLFNKNDNYYKYIRLYKKKHENRFHKKFI